MKQILFSLALASTAAQSMELTVLHNPDMLFHITEQICTIDNGDPKEAKKNIALFAATNKTLYEYYSREKTQQNIVRQVALHKDLSDSMIALYFGYTKIKKKIDDLFAKINSRTELTQEDLLDHWYLNSTIPCTSVDKAEQETLLLRAIEDFNFTAAKQLITASIDCSSTRCKENPLALITIKCRFNKGQLKKESCLDVITLLLENNLHPDSRISTAPTLLHLAALTNHKQLAHLLLQYGVVLSVDKNAFELERGEPKGWLTAMVNEIEKGKKNS